MIPLRWRGSTRSRGALPLWDKRVGSSPQFPFWGLFSRFLSGLHEMLCSSYVQPFAYRWGNSTQLTHGQAYSNNTYCEYSSLHSLLMLLMPSIALYPLLAALLSHVRHPTQYTHDMMILQRGSTHNAQTCTTPGLGPGRKRFLVFC